MKTVKSMNEVWSDSVGKTLFIEGQEWGVITDVRTKAGVDLQWIVDGIRLVTVTEEKVLQGMFQLV